MLGESLFFDTIGVELVLQPRNLKLIDSQGAEGPPMKQKNVSDKTCYEQMSHRKQAYAIPSLRVYGSIKQLTQGTGSVNGDAGQGMMVGM